MNVGNGRWIDQSLEYNFAFSFLIVFYQTRVTFNALIALFCKLIFNISDFISSVLFVIMKAG